MNKKWRIRIIAIAALLGAFIGARFGIAGMGSAIAATVPLASIFAYLAYRWTKPRKSKPTA